MSPPTHATSQMLMHLGGGGCGRLVSLAQALEGLQATQVMLMLLINRCPGENHWSELEGGSHECGGRGRQPGLLKKLNQEGEPAAEEEAGNS